jgi:hypothetical protein
MSGPGGASTVWDTAMSATEHRPAQSRRGDPSQRGEVNSSPATAPLRTGVFCPSVAEQSSGPIGPDLVRCGASSESKDGVAEGQLDSIETNSKLDAPTLPERVKRSRSKAARSVAWQERQRLVNRETGEILAGEDGNLLTLADVVNSRTLMYQRCAANVYQKNERTHCESLS